MSREGLSATAGGTVIGTNPVFSKSPFWGLWLLGGRLKFGFIFQKWGNCADSGMESGDKIGE
jgi:hypothetical protein